MAIGMLWYLLNYAPRQSPVDLDLLDREEAFRNQVPLGTLIQTRNPEPSDI